MATVGARVGDGRYELRQELDSGYFGTVYEAWDLAEDTRVAVKLLRPWVQPDAVLQEARLHRRLSEHSRIVTMRNVIIAASPSPFVIFDFVPDGSLKKFMASRRPTVVEAQRWLRDTLEALSHAHSNLVLHRDVKPSNLLMAGNGHVMLTDFGVAEDSIRRAARAPGMYPLILPPEFPAVPTSVQTDLWLVGILGWQLLVGERPDLASAHGGTLELPHRRSLEVPMALSRAIMAGLDPDPAGRPSSADRLLEQVAAVPIRAGWFDHSQTDPTVVQAWQADAAGGGVIVRIRRRARGGLEVTATAPPGHRLRHRRHELCSTEAGARQRARAWLEQVVSGTPL